MIQATIIGGTGYTGGELLRILAFHPQVEVTQVTSRRSMGEYVYQTHPNLRKVSQLKFISPDVLEPTQVCFLALPHGEAQHKMEELAQKFEYMIDLSADFRLKDPAAYQKWYGEPHAAPEWLPKFTYGLPELHREELKSARYVSGVGCNATACNLSMYPLLQAGLIDTSAPVIFEIKVGSSEGGASENPGSHHPERSSVIRTYAPYGHRHTAEVIQELGLSKVSLTMTSVDLVRGALATGHATVKAGVEAKDLWKAYREAAASNPFLRVAKERRGVYRVPEPKILAGSNYADLGFDLDPESGHVIAICAIDNLMKGASGTAVQCMNLMLGFDETLGLSFPGLHPV
ncbi:MAG: N-acetyl-gamma-glutamyl-phosphate reductase [Chloroflexi bacterium]|nr:N-acetyl-gamma-glutamyl-phosphate reductase [Chloroflexota bacterium]